MSDETTKTPAAAAAKAPAAKIGDVLQTSEGRYAIVVGTEKVRHVHQGPDGEQTDTVSREHPLVVDLGTARRHELAPHQS